MAKIISARIRIVKGSGGWARRCFLCQRGHR
jgi:hypothetical protein